VIPFIYKDIKGDIAVKVVAENPEDIEKKFKPVVKEDEELNEEKNEEQKKDNKLETKKDEKLEEENK
jgi:hypothetical protein